MSEEQKKELVSSLMEKNYLITPGLLSQIPHDFDYGYFFDAIAPTIELAETAKSIPEAYFLELLKKKDSLPDNCTVNIIESYNENSIKREIKHFVMYFRKRYETMRKILETRLELQGAVSIARLSSKTARDNVALIGLISEKNITKKGNTLVTMEDMTGSIKVVLRKDNKEMGKAINELVLDEVVGITGVADNGIVFAREIYFPDIPYSKELKKSPDEVHAAFISDFHVGSNMFLPSQLERFISWINGNVGTDEQKKTALKVKYIFVAGDLVDGVGIYPEQDNELVIKEIKEQYKECARYLSMIRKDVKIIVCGGNHDALRLAEPQPVLDIRFAAAISELPNVTVVSNPSYVNIHASDGFPGFDVLMYHGYSFDYYASNVDSIRTAGGYDRVDLIMELLLRKRHLCPTHSSTLYIPDQDRDPLIIEKIPDFFVTGHIHRSKVSSYKNVTTVCCSCWQAKTAFQEKTGHNPEPARVPIVNLQTRMVKIFKFGD
ncbi:MAG: DNA-directed DNA polymerase II small subunit [Candidatus Woesearchaeota archaeon]